MPIPANTTMPYPLMHQVLAEYLNDRYESLAPHPYSFRCLGHGYEYVNVGFFRGYLAIMCVKDHYFYQDERHIIEYADPDLFNKMRQIMDNAGAVKIGN